MRKALLLSVLVIMSFTLIATGSNFISYLFATQNKEYNKQPTIKDEGLKVQLVTSGLKAPTSIAFLDKKDILVLERYNGTVMRIINDTLIPKPLLDVNVSRIIGERGMLGITVSKSIQPHTYVFLYYTESATGKDGDDITLKKEPLGNRLYRYEYIDGNLVNPKLLLDLPVKPGPYHNGGSLAIGPDNNLYLTIGDLDNVNNTIRPATKASNVVGGKEPNGSGGILRITQDGKIVGEGIIGTSHPLNLYFAYGIRNSFGIDFDPVTGNLWDTENGPNFGDEINLVKSGFNGGWNRVQGIWREHNGNIGNIEPNPAKDLVDFNGKGKYSAPEFIWKNRHGLTGIKFLDSKKLGAGYENDLFVGDIHNQTIYHFDLNSDRDQLSLDGLLQDRIADNEKELHDTIFAQNFEGGITDLEVGPDGYLYVVSGIWSDSGKVYRIIPNGN